MGWAVGAAIITAASTYYSVSESNKAQVRGAERQNELIRQQHAADLAKQKSQQAIDAQRAKMDEQANRESISGEEDAARKRASSLTEEDASDTLLTGSYGVKNALRRKTSIGV